MVISVLLAPEYPLHHRLHGSYYTAAYKRPSILLSRLIDESPRWLSSHGYLAKSTKVMKKIANINRRPYPRQQIVESSDSRRSQGNFIDLFRPAKQLMKTVPLSIGWYISRSTYSLS